MGPPKKALLSSLNSLAFGLGSIFSHSTRTRLDRSAALTAAVTGTAEREPERRLGIELVMNLSLRRRYN